MTAMKHAYVIAHAAQHKDGWESVEGDFQGTWIRASEIFNPITSHDRQWRIKPATLRIVVEIPKPVTTSTGDATKVLLIGGLSVGTPIIFDSKAARDVAECILVAALRGESK